MTETHEPDLSNIKPVSDADASRYLSVETHAWLCESIVAGQAGGVDPAAHVARRQLSRHARPTLKVRKDGDRRGVSRRVGLAALLVAIVAALIVVLPGLLSNDGSVTQPLAAQAQILHRITTALSRQPATILIQRIRTEMLNTQAGTAPRTAFGPVSLLEIDQASQDGSVQRSFSTSSEERPGFQDLSAGNSLQIYDASNKTIYETTLAAWQAAVQRSFSHGSLSTFSYSGADSTGPGDLSVFEQRLRQHLYRLGGRTTVDGQAALKLVPVQASIPVPSTGDGSAREYLGTVYVSPTTYYPIKEVTRVPSAGSPLGNAPGTIGVIINVWSQYKIIPATAKNAGLVSLTARHPHARIVHGAKAYLAVSAAESHH